MKRRITALVLYAIFWIVFFFVARLFFILTHPAEASASGAAQMAASFVHGLKLDISVTGYIMLLPVLLMIPGVWIKGNWYRIFMRWYTYIIVLVSSCIVVSDTLLYKYWGFRMDVTPLMYIDTPKDAAASVTAIQFAGIFTGIALLTGIFIFFYKRVPDRYLEGFDKIKQPIPAMLLFVLLLGSLILPIRGGTGVAPVNAGTVYFSKDTFTNHTAVNVIWNLGSSVINREPSRNPYEFTGIDEARNLVDSLTADTGKPEILLNNSRPDILLIVLESFGSVLTRPLGGDTLTTPNFNRLVREGVLFTNFYASGFRTDKAMPAILNGYPAQPAASIMKEPRKTQSLPGITKTLKGEGYSCSFWYGGDINFANFHSFVLNSGFTRIITKDNFSPENYNSKWGVHDQVLLEMLRDSMQKVREPFFNVVLTLSSHEPFEVPMQPVFSGKDEFTKFRNSVYYTDRALGWFIDWAKTTGWWKNTLVVLVADHYRRNTPDDKVYSEEIFRIPMLWLGGAVSAPGKRITKTGSQVDIPISILHQLGSGGQYPFAKDLLSDRSHSFAFYTFNEGFGFFTDSSRYIWDHKAGRPVVNEGKDPDLAGRAGKAYLEVLFDDYLNR